MVSYLLGGISSFLLGEEDDDPMCLKDVVLIAVYESPHKQLGVSLNAAPWEVRDALRLNCIRLLGETYFNKLDKPKLPYKYSLIAFHLIMKTLNVTKAQHLKSFMEKNPTAFDGRPKDMLQILRPVHCEGIPMNAGVRACAMLQVLYVETLFSAPEGDRDYVMPHQKYVLRVVYCGRCHLVRKRYSDFYDLNENMADELLMVPGFPPKDALYKVGLADYSERGRALCAYVNRVHASLAARGVFSPRLMDFLGVDAARVHIEEDGRVSKLLDTAGVLQGSAWHMVEETWLKRWRKFVLGRGARRYEPPGPITNELLLLERKPYLREDEKDEKDDERATTVPRFKRRLPRTVAPTHREIKALGNKDKRHIYLPEPSPEPTAPTAEPEAAPSQPRHKGSVFSAVASKGVEGITQQQPEHKETLALVRHYRAINYNLWVYWKMVHGGGPCISRKSKDIMSQPSCGTGMEAVSRLQRFGRMVLGKQERLDLYWKHLSRTAPGVREVLALWEERKLRERAEATIKASKTERTKSRLQLAARYTQRTWRAKKQYAFNDDNVRVQKHAQEIFAMADGEVERAAPGAPFVVEEGESIVKLGVVERFDVKFTDLDGPTLPMTLKKHSCSELTFIQTVAPVDPERKSERKQKQLEELVPDCILLLVNNYPVSSLTHKQVMDRITSAKWPLTLRFEKPLDVRAVRSFKQVVKDERDHKFGRDDDDFKLQLLKRLLHMGIPLRKYGRKGAPHDTVLYLNETIVFWEQKTAAKLHEETKSLSKKYDLTRGLPLYDLKYVRIDKVSSVFRGASARKARPNCCFTLFAETRTLDFEVVTVDDDADMAPDGRRLLAWAFDSIIKEARGSKIFVDKTGAPIRRTAPKKRLRMVR